METSEGPSLFQCGCCKRQYRRLDHLARHVRSHTQSRPHKCNICGKRFTRTDLLKRHIGSHNTQRENQSTQSSTQPDAGSGRVSRACRACSAQHLRCSEEKPCRRCKDKDLDCIWTTPADAFGLYSPPPTDCVSDGTVQEDAQNHRSEGSASILESGAPDPNSDMQLGTIEVALEIPDSHRPKFSSEMSVNSIDPQLTLDDMDFSNFWMPQPNDFDLGAPGIEINDQDLQFLDRYNLSIPFERAPNSQPQSRDEQTVPRPSAGDDLENLGFGTHESPWLFQPNAHDHTGAEESNLSLPQDVSDHASPESRVPQDGSATKTPLTTAARDKMVAMVARCCQSDNVSKIFVAFPSVELLNALVQYYFTSPVAWPHLVLHAPTFDPNGKPPELVSAIAAAGAILTSDPVLVKLGYAIHEAVRVSVPTHWEKDNSQVRDLELAQAFLIVLEVGLWSGHGRKVEIAESFTQPLLTMLRRGKRFKSTQYTRKLDRVDLVGKDLDRYWKECIEQESFQRLCFRLLLHDTHSSMALLVNPLISYAEVLLPVPGSARLWAARSAEEWKSAYNSDIEQSSWTLTELLDTPDILVRHYGSLEYNVAAFALQSFMWALTWEYIQLKTLQRKMPRRRNSAIMDMRREELVKLIQTMRISLSICASHEFLMRLEATSMHLFMSFEDIQTLAGFEGPVQSRAIFPVVKEWISTEDARQALYHASQIFRFAKAAQKGSLRGPSLFMLYYASLAFWVWGLLEEHREQIAVGSADRRTSSHFAMPSFPAKEVFLDEQDDILVQRFIQLGQGIPCIRVHEHDGDSMPITTKLSSTPEVMDSVRQLLEDNFHSTARPALVSKMTGLITELGKSYKRARGLNDSGQN